MKTHIPSLLGENNVKNKSKLNKRTKYLKPLFMPWLVWLSGLSASLQTEKGCWFNFLSRAHAWVWARSPVGGLQEAASECFFHTLIFLSLSLSLPFPLSKNKIFKKKKHIHRRL